MKKIITLLMLSVHFFAFASEHSEKSLIHSSADSKVTETITNLVVSTKKIALTDYPGAFNPSIIKYKDGYLLSFRYFSDPSQLWISQIGIVLLNSSLEPISKPVLLNTRHPHSKTPSQSEDVRLFRFEGDIYLCYNDNEQIINPNHSERREIFICKLIDNDEQFTLGQPLMIYHEKKYPHQKWQKNWVPFTWQNSLMMGYSINPHEILSVDMKTGKCSTFHETKGSLAWKWGALRGGTQADLFDGEYLAFFHSSKEIATYASNNKKMWHYFMGAYTFSGEPPFHVTKITPTPITASGFYTRSNLSKRVIFPGGYVVDGSKIHVAYGKDDQEIWIATIDANVLKQVLQPVN